MNSSFGERGFAVAQIKVPKTNKGLVIAKRPHFINAAHELSSPESQRLNIVRGNVLLRQHPHICGAPNCVGQRRYRRQATARENVFSNKVDVTDVVFVILLSDSD